MLRSYAVEWTLERASVRPATEADEPRPVRASPSGVMERLGAAKARVPDVRRRLGASAWHGLVDANGRWLRAPRPNVVSRAYYKLHEIVCSCALPLPKRSLHLCEAPGGFVQCTADLLAEEAAEAAEEGAAAEAEWSWTAVSRADDGPAFDEERLPMARGGIVLADVLDVATTLEALPSATYDLVTADGAAAMDHADLEAEHRPLLVAQTRVALRSLAPGGCLVVKFFEGRDRHTQLWIARLSTCFRRVSLIKPHSSRATNSERYLVGRHYEPSSAEEDDDGWDTVDALVVADGWRARLCEVLDRMAAEQTQALERALDVATSLATRNAPRR